MAPPPSGHIAPPPSQPAEPASSAAGAAAHRHAARAAAGTHAQDPAGHAVGQGPAPTLPPLRICPHCDSVDAPADLQPGEVAHCVRCDAVLGRGSRFDLDTWLALTLAAALLAGFALSQPLLVVEVGGVRGEASLWGAVRALSFSEARLFALPTLLFFLAVPLVQVLLLLWVLGHARLGRPTPGMAGAMRWLARLRPWSMAEVGLLGALIAVSKLSKMMAISAGVGLWSLAVFAVLLIAVATRDLSSLWAQPRPGEALDG